VIVERRPYGLPTIVYVVALAAVVVLCAVTLVILADVISAQRGDMAVIDAAGRQLMLSQRIALFAEQINFNQNESARGHILGEAAAMLRTEAALTSGNGDLGITHGLSAQAHALYFAAPGQLDAHTRDFAAAAQKLALSHDPVEEQVAYHLIMDDSAQSILPLLNQALRLFSEEADARIDALRHAQAMVLILMLLAIVSCAIPAFRPLRHGTGPVQR